jgi:hypothetical protein
MKNRIFIRAALVLIVVWLAGSCETDIQKAQDAYKPTDVVPVVISTAGPTLVLQTKTYSFKVTYHRAGSTWTWSGVDATVQSVSEDTKTASVVFNTLPANNIAHVKVTETTSAGVTSDEKIIDVTVKPFCPLTGGMADLAGSWGGEDAYYESIIAMTADGASTVKATGIGVGFIEDWWAEEVVTGGNVVITVNDDGTLNIPRQFLFTTLYDGDNYDYEIIGSGTWDNCTTTPTMKITYDIYYEGDAKGLAATYASYLDNIPYLTIDIALDAKKGDIVLKSLQKPSFKNR